VAAAKMKAGEEHVVPLSRQAPAVLKESRQINGRSVRLFVNSHAHQKPMSENTILYALYRMGYHSRATGHGFRATAATILNFGTSLLFTRAAPRVMLIAASVELGHRSLDRDRPQPIVAPRSTKRSLASTVEVKHAWLRLKLFDWCPTRVKQTKQ
jgi:integrase